MREHVAEIDGVGPRIAAAWQLFDVVIASVDATAPSGASLRTRAETARGEPDVMIAHEYLAPINMPFYFDEFVQRLEPHGLRHLGDLTKPDKPRIDFGTQAPDAVQRAEDIRGHQYGDFITDQTLRGAVLCRRDNQDAPMETHAQAALPVATALVAESPIIFDESQASFTGKHGTTSTTSPVVKMALDDLSQIWPESRSIRQLAGEVGARLSPGSAANGDVERVLIDTFLDLRSYGAVELLCQPYSFTTMVSERPEISPTARLEALRGAPLITNRRHESLELDDALRFVARHLDGTKTETDLIALAAEEAQSLGFAVKSARGTTIHDPRELARTMRWLAPSIDVLAEQAMLIA